MIKFDIRDIRLISEISDIYRDIRLIYMRHALDVLSIQCRYRGVTCRPNDAGPRTQTQYFSALNGGLFCNLLLFEGIQHRRSAETTPSIGVGYRYRYRIKSC